MEKLMKKDKRSIWLVLPVILLPFSALAFYALGGGRVEEKQVKEDGINTTLPAASLKGQQEKGKLEIYNSEKRDTTREGGGISAIAEKLGFQQNHADQKTVEIEDKISRLNLAMKQDEEKPQRVTQSRALKVPGMGSDVDRLEQLMKTMQQGKGEDKEMSQLSGMLEKVLDIQHPERVRDAYIRQVNDSVDSLFTAIPAVVQVKQLVMQGSTLKLVFQDSVRIGGVFFPKGQEASGIVNLTNQRLLLDIKTIRIGKKIIPVDLSVYGMDGIKGINAPDAIVQSAVTGGADDAFRSIQLLGMDNSIGTQMASAGIDAAKGLFSKKVRKVRVKLNAGYQLLLRNNQRLR